MQARTAPDRVDEASPTAGVAADAAIVADRVTKVYPARDGSDILALDEFSLSVAPGEFVGIIGPSGCGKSTFLKMVAGLESISSGTITRGGKAVSRSESDLGFVFQAATLLPWLNVLDNVLVPARVQGLPLSAARERARGLLESVGLAGFEQHYPSELSGGMQQRVAITRALLHDPAVLLMDEPFAALDALTRDRLSVELQGILMEQRKPVLFVTHSIPEALFLSDRVIVMSARPGRIIAEFDLRSPRPRSIDDAYSDKDHIGAEIRALLTEENPR